MIFKTKWKILTKRRGLGRANQLKLISKLLGFNQNRMKSMSRRNMNKKQTLSKLIGRRHRRRSLQMSHGWAFPEQSQFRRLMLKKQMLTEREAGKKKAMKVEEQWAVIDLNCLITITLSIILRKIRLLKKGKVLLTTKCLIRARLLGVLRNQISPLKEDRSHGLVSVSNKILTGAPPRGEEERRCLQLVE
jgi:hypothetical protein